MSLARPGVAAALLAALVLAPATAAAGELLLSAEQGYESLDGDRPAWRSAALAAGWSGKAGSVRGEWREVSRFGVSDRQWSAGATALQDRIALTIEFSGSPDHELLPQYSAGFELGVPVAAGFVAHAGARRNAYTEEDAEVYRASGEYYRGAARAAWTLVHGRLESGDSGTAHVLQGDWYYGEANRVGLVAAAGGEATRTGPDTVIVADVRNAALVGRHWLQARWGVSYVLSWTEQGDFYTRWGGALGLLYRL